MFLHFHTDDRKSFMLFTLMDSTNRIIHLGCAKFSQLTLLADAPPFVVDGAMTLVVIDRDDDRNKLLNRAVEWCEINSREDLKRQILQNTVPRKRIVCHETGENFPSVNAACRAHGVAYGQLSSHLKKMVGYRTVKGRTYSTVEV
jgi:hypothetical protein